jgi:hypothetical protein
VLRLLHCQRPLIIIMVLLGPRLGVTGAATIISGACCVMRRCRGVCKLARSKARKRNSKLIYQQRRFREFYRICHTAPGRRHHWSNDFSSSATGNTPPQPIPLSHTPSCLPHRSPTSTSEINEITRGRWGQPGFTDPGIRDAKLSPAGIALAQARAPIFQQQHSQILADAQLIVSSPLTRALHTAELLLPPPDSRQSVPMIMHPLLTERVHLM